MVTRGWHDFHSCPVPVPQICSCPVPLLEEWLLSHLVPDKKIAFIHIRTAYSYIKTDPCPAHSPWLFFLSCPDPVTHRIPEKESASMWPPCDLHKPVWHAFIHVCLNTDNKEDKRMSYRGVSFIRGAGLISTVRKCCPIHSVLGKLCFSSNE